MSIFQKSVEQKYLAISDYTLIDSQLASFKNYFDNLQIQQNIRNNTDKEIDQIVYELQGLSKEEIKSVRGKNSYNNQNKIILVMADVFI
ncbi:MAG: hypothetical protein WCX31_00105 [Salinivirgaceae bacterium]|jgi:hypothetical protein